MRAGLAVMITRYVLSGACEENKTRPQIVRIVYKAILSTETRDWHSISGKDHAIETPLFFDDS
jgi:hypothetical protein